ncbi:hypothetical protein BJ165DRAFT_1613160 [Panaeolus papilionaceus]|nr:hypothetical protein BJ165DRAFT_1613160 [Panaeolus papilionaceus]
MPFLTRVAVLLPIAMLCIQTFVGVVASPLAYEIDAAALGWTDAVKKASNIKKVQKGQEIGHAMAQLMSNAADDALAHIYDEHGTPLDPFIKQSLETAFGSRWKQQMSQIQAISLSIKLVTMKLVPWPTPSKPPGAGVLAVADLTQKVLHLTDLFFAEKTSDETRGMTSVHEASHFSHTRDYFKKIDGNWRPVMSTSVTEQDIKTGIVIRGYWHLEFQSLLCWAPDITSSNADSYAVWGYMLKYRKEPPNKGKGPTDKKDCVIQ